jgi:penicillin-binding protein 1A
VRRLFRFVLIVIVGALGIGACIAALVPGTETLFASSRFSSKIADHLSTLSQRTLVYDSAGNQIGIFAADDRERVKLDQVPKVLQNAVIATEDRTFWKNPGVDIASSVRALWANVRSGAVEQGGSTITQQLIKNRILTPKRDLNRKLREVVLAYRFASQFSKKQILEEYLNTVYFGQGSYGVKTAAERFYNGESLDQLTLGQSALIAGLIRNPEGDNPFSHPDRARARQIAVLQNMLKQHYITTKQMYTAALEPLPTKVPPPEHKPDNYFLAEVEQRLFDDPRLGATATERQNKVLRGGLRVYTTYDPGLQYLAQLAVDGTLQQAQPRDRDITASMVVMDPQTGAVRAMVGGPGFNTNQYNIVTHYPGRQPGSTFKAVSLTSALENGYSPNDTVSGDSPCTVSFPKDTAPGAPPVVYPTRNAEPGGGTESIRTATENSVNCAYVRIGASLGLDKVTEMAHRLGVCAGSGPACTNSQLPHYPSIVIGSVGETPLDMATVFNTFAADGVRHDPIFITRVVGPDGKTIFDNTRIPGDRVISTQVARGVTDILQGVIKRGTGTRADIGRPAAGKTGTTDGERDAWFDGYTPQLTAVVWMGRTDSEQPMGRVGRFGSVFGGTWPAMIWHNFMQAALANQPVMDFTPPDPSLWPGSRYITDKGRGTGSSSSSFAPFPNFPAPTTPTTVAPKPTKPTTPTTKKPPPTKPPPTSTPPTSDTTPTT